MADGIAALLMMAAGSLCVAAFIRFPDGMLWAAGVVCFVASRIIYVSAHG